MQTQANDLNRQLNNANNDKNGLNGEINSLKSQLQSAQTNKNNYYNQVQDLNKQVSSWKNDYYRKVSEIDNLSRQLSSEKSDNNYLRSRISGLESELKKEREENIQELFVLGENQYDSKPNFEIHGVHVEPGEKYKINDEWGSAYFGNTVGKTGGWGMGDGSPMSGVVRARFEYKKVLARVIRVLKDSTGVEHEWCFPHQDSNYCNYKKKYL